MKKSLCKSHPTSLLILVFFLGSCARITYHGIKPVDPVVSKRLGTQAWFPKVDSLNPTLVWEPIGDPDISYDLIITNFDEAIVVQFGCFPTRFNWPSDTEKFEIIYYRENLKETQHKVEETLRRKSFYMWSIRARHGKEVFAWSKFDHFLWVVLAWGSRKNFPFVFRTP